jgi:hypothetical protein
MPPTNISVNGILVMLTITQRFLLFPETLNFFGQELVLQRDFLRRVGKSGALPTAFCRVGTLVGKQKPLPTLHDGAVILDLSL